jgi:hypothetical protein
MLLSFNTHNRIVGSYTSRSKAGTVATDTITATNASRLLGRATDTLLAESINALLAARVLKEVHMDLFMEPTVAATRLMVQHAVHRDYIPC